MIESARLSGILKVTPVTSPRIKLEKRVKETEGEDNQHQQQKVEAMVISQDGRVAVRATAFREIGLQTCKGEQQFPSGLGR